MLFEIYIFIGTSLLLGFCVFNEDVKERVNKFLNEVGIVYGILGVSVLIIVMPIVVIAGLLKRKK